MARKSMAEKKAKPAGEHQAAHILHTGDLVLLKTQLRENDLYAEAGEIPGDTGWVAADGLRGECSIKCVDSLHLSGLDVREFLFVVVEQLNYIAQKDLARCKKHMARQPGGPAASQLAQLKTLEERARHEAEQNVERMQGGVRPLAYGEVVQLQHLRTKRFLRVYTKKHANLQKTSRTVDLHVGSSNSWLRMNPLFKHKAQGVQINLGEQLLFESVKLGNNWSLNWACCRNIAKDQIREVNCAKPGRGFYVELYSRSVAQDTKVLSCPSPLRLLHSHHRGFVSGSCSLDKLTPYLRRPGAANEQHVKDIWVIEPGLPDGGDSGIEWDSTTVVLRHFGSGRYLAVSGNDLESGGCQVQPLGEIQIPQSPKSRRGKRPNRSAFKSSTLGSPSAKVAAHLPLAGPPAEPLPSLPPFVSTELVETPGYLSWFVLEPCDILENNGGMIPRGGHMMVRWDDPTGAGSFWLSCQGLVKGSRNSLKLQWSSTRYTRDAIRIDVLDDPIDVMDDSTFVYHCDVVAEHTRLLRKVITPRCRDFGDMNVAALVCAQCEHAFTDMIFFLTDSPHWRATQEGQKQYIEPDPLSESWVSSADRQALVLGLKYIDATFELFHEFVAHVPALMDGDTRWGRRAVALNLGLHAKPHALPAVGHADSSNWDIVMGNMVACMKTRCLKLLVRLWMCCFIGSRKIENYFFKNGWVDTINKLNGHGLGASDVFVALMSNNAKLVRQVERSTILKFIDFIRVLGPLDTWMSFLTAVCAPAETAVGAMQQMVLCTLVFAGHRASDAEREATSKNRKELLITPKLLQSAPLNIPLGNPLLGSPPPPLEQCLGQSLLVEGLCDIVISWAHPQQWVVGRGVVYHGPHALGLHCVEGHAALDSDRRSWVSMAELVWVLQPERCCPAVKGISYEEFLAEKAETGDDGGVDVFRTLDTATACSGQSERLKTLAQYLLAQLQLVSDLVKERQMNCIMAMQEEYSFDLCVTGMSDPRLPTTIRAAFYDILTDLWLDRYPHVQVVVPTLMRNLEAYESDLDQLPRFMLKTPEAADAWSADHHDLLPAEVLSFYRLTKPPKMEAVLQALRKFLSAGPYVEQQVHTETDDTVLMSAMLRTLTKLLRFGFIHHVALLKDILSPLLRCVDGRTDLLAPLPEHLDGGPGSSGEGNEHFAMDLPEPITPLLQASRSESRSRRQHSGVLPKWRYPPLDEGARYEDSDDNRKVMACKIQILNMLLHIVQFSVHTKTSHVLHVFRSMVLDSDHMQSALALGQGVVLPFDVLEQFCRALDHPTIELSAEGVRNPTAMFVDLMMYRHPKLFSLALELYFQECCQTEAMMEVLDRVELMTTPQLETFEAIQEDIAILGKLVYSFENWGVDDQFSSVDNAKFMQVQRVCLKLRSLALVGDSNSTALEIQKMLHETEFFSHFCYIVQTDATDYAASARPLLAKVTALICSCARSFVAANPKNQALVFEVLDCAMWLLDAQPDMALLAVEVFRGNRELCQQVTADLVNRFAELIVRDRQLGKTGPWYLLFFNAIVVAQGTPIVRNQALVIEALKQRSPTAMLHLMQGEDGLDRVVKLADGFSSMGQLRDLEASRWVGGADGELIYYITSVEVLIGVACGHGSQVLVNRPFVSTLFPATSLMRLLLRTSRVRAPPPNGMKHASVHVRLKIIWMKLARLLLYDVEKNMVDIDLLASPLHVEFFQEMLDWIERALRPERAQGGNAQEQLPDDTVLLSDDDEEHTRAMLLCVDDFFKNLYSTVSQYDICHPLLEATTRYATFFTKILHTTAGLTGPACGLRDVSLLRITAHRVVSVVSPQRAAEFERHVPPRLSRRKRRTAALKPQAEHAISSAMEAQWHTMLEALMEDPMVHSRIASEEAKLGHIVTRISDMTDPEHVKYQKLLPAGPQGCLPDGVDFRRNVISTQAVLERFVLHAQDHLTTDLPSMRRIQRVLLSTLRGARDAGDVPLLLRLQGYFAEAGVVQLIIRMLHLRLADDITEHAWVLLAEVLCTGVRDDGQWVPCDDEQTNLVNAAVQECTWNVCTNGDDSGMWESLKDVFNGVGMRIKYSHALRRLPSMTDEESVQAANYEKALAKGVLVMEAVRLTVEGHYFPMQQYLFSQVGNSRSCNVPEVTAAVLMGMCKDPSAPNSMEYSEIRFISHNLTLLQELAQGPNLRNQELLSTMGIVETCFMMCSASFERIQRFEGDVYPSPIRLLKASFVELVLSLLEGRMDKRIHSNVLRRADTQVVRERLELVHLYFAFGSQASTTNRAAGSGPAAVPLGSRAQLLLSPSMDPTKLHHELVPASLAAEELLEDLSDAELDELFSEGLSMLELIYQLEPHSQKFKEEVVLTTDDFFPERRVDFPGSDREYERERAAFHKRANYRLAFNFLARFVSTIEVILEGNLQPLHFQQPLTAMWYVQEASKQHILDVIPFSSPDIKARAFIQMCIEVHTESKLIRDLSRFSVVPAPCLPFARRHLPDGIHRPFQVFLANDARLMQQLLQVDLMVGLALAVHVGSFLVPVDSDEFERTRWSSGFTEKIAYSMGGVYFCCTLLWVTVTVCIKVPLYIIRLRAMGRSERRKSWFVSVGESVLSICRDTFFMWRLALLCFCGVALFQRHFWIFSFLLLDFFCQNSLLATVLLAIKAPFGSLLMTFLGAALVTNVYAAIGFHWFREEFGQYCEPNIVTCTQNILYQGTRNGIIGLSSMMRLVMPGAQDWPERMAYDISYFIVFGIMILNTIVGLIVDSFGALRHEQEARMTNQSTQTFISCIDRKKIEALAQSQGISNGFEYHEQFKQNKWDYMAFIFHLREKPVHQYTGPEQAIRTLVEAGDYKWMPIARSRLVETADADQLTQDDALQRIEARLNSMSSEVSGAEGWRHVARGVADLTSALKRRLDELQEEVERYVEAAQANVQALSTFGGGLFSRGKPRVQGL